MKRYNKRGESSTGLILLVFLMMSFYALVASQERLAMKQELDRMYGTLFRIEQQQQLDARAISELREVSRNR